MYAKCGSRRIVFERNYVHDAGPKAIGVGIQLGGHSGKYTYTAKSVIEFEGAKGSEGIDQIARNNLIVNVPEGALRAKGARNGKFYNNTAVNCGTVAGAVIIM